MKKLAFLTLGLIIIGGCLFVIGYSKFDMTFQESKKEKKDANQTVLMKTSEDKVRIAEKAIVSGNNNQSGDVSQNKEPFREYSIFESDGRYDDLFNDRSLKEIRVILNVISEDSEKINKLFTHIQEGQQQQEVLFNELEAGGISKEEYITQTDLKTVQLHQKLIEILSEKELQLFQKYTENLTEQEWLNIKDTLTNNLSEEELAANQKLNDELNEGFNAFHKSLEKEQL